MDVKKYINDQGKIAVLISPGFGAGWATLNSEYKDFLLFDRGLVELAQRNAKQFEVEGYLKSKGIEAYAAGWDSIKICWMDPETEFCVEEYYGNESLRYRNDGEL